MNSNEVNIAVAKLREWTNIREGQYMDGGTDIFGIPPGAEDEQPIPDYYHSLDAAVAAAEELLKGVAVNKIDNIWSVSWADKTGEWHVMPVMIDATLQAIAAAICETILQAHGVTVASESESEVSDGNE